MNQTLEVSPSPEINFTAPPADEVKYDILKPDSYHTKITSQDELLEKYAELLDVLVQKIAGKEGQPGFDTVVFLDKSARPLYWMMREFWPEMAPQTRDDQTGVLATAPMPEVKFANIDRLAWRNDPGKEMNHSGSKKVTQDDIDGLRSIFTLPNKDKSEFDGKRVLIIDEQSESGDTLRISRELFEKSFPEAEIDTASWIKHLSIENDVEGQPIYDVKEMPMWYPEKHPKTKLHKDTGRGVLSALPYDPANPAHVDRIPPEAYKFLSTKPYIPKEKLSDEDKLNKATLVNELQKVQSEQEKTEIERKIFHIDHEYDPESRQLRTEIMKMKRDFVAGKIAPILLGKREEVLGVPRLDYLKNRQVLREKRARY